MTGDGNGWARCALGHLHWGRYGAAGVLISDGRRVMLQHRAAWTHEGDTWAVPGGARDSHESAVTAALREAAEETDVDLNRVQPFREWVDDHGGWSYTTVLARALGTTGAPDPAVLLDARPVNAESVAIRWWPFDEVATLHLHHGFAGAWPHLLDLLRDA
jgi:8-oxo-dGTP pyrophosphatase MutT (NUDIX family)